MKPLLSGLTASLALASGGCVSLAPVAPPVTPAMIASAGVPSTTLNLGRQLYGGRCTACHTADPVSKYSVAEWRDIVSDMAERSKLRTEERSALLAYITAARTSGVPATAAR